MHKISPTRSDSVRAARNWNLIKSKKIFFVFEYLAFDAFDISGARLWLVYKSAVGSGELWQTKTKTKLLCFEN